MIVFCGSSSEGSQETGEVCRPNVAIGATDFKSICTSFLQFKGEVSFAWEDS